MKFFVVLLLLFSASSFAKRGFTKDGFVGTPNTEMGECTVQSTSATWVDCGGALAIPDNSVYKVVVECNGKRTDNAEFAAIDKCALMRRATGVTTLEGSVVTTFDQPGTSGWDMLPKEVGNDVKIQVKSPSETVDWTCEYRLVKR